MLEIGYYVPLQETTDEIQELNGNAYNQVAQSLTGSGYEIHNSSPETYPDLVNAAPFTVMING